MNLKLLRKSNIVVFGDVMLDRYVYSYLASSLKTNLILFPLKTKNFNTFPLTLDVKYKMHQLILDNKVYSIFA